jgi:hypothetical protein
MTLQARYADHLSNPISNHQHTIRRSCSVPRVRFLLTFPSERRLEKPMPAITRSQTGGVRRILNPDDFAPESVHFPCASQWTSKHLKLLGVKQVRGFVDLAVHLKWNEAEWSEEVSNSTSFILLSS